MSMYTKEQFEEYKGNNEFLAVEYYPDTGTDRTICTIGYHETYEEYVEFFDSFYEQEKRDNVTIPRELLLYLQERVDPQNEYSVWMSINKYLSTEG